MKINIRRIKANGDELFNERGKLEKITTTSIDVNVLIENFNEFINQMECTVNFKPYEYDKFDSLNNLRNWLE
ncbi:MAG: hypothetical protein ACOCZ5_01925 [bacterium]